MNQHEDNPQSPRRIPTIEGGNESPAGSRSALGERTLSSDSPSNGSRQRTNSDAHSDTADEWASTIASAVPRTILRSASAGTGTSNHQGVFLSASTLPSWQDPQSESRNSISSSGVPPPPTVLPSLNTQQRRKDAAVTVFESPSTSADSVRVGRTDATRDADTPPLEPLAPPLQDKRPRITFSTTVTSSSANPSAGAGFLTSQQQSQLDPPSPQVSPTLEHAQFAFPLGSRPKNASTSTSAQSLGSAPSPAFYQVAAHGSISFPGSTNLKGGSGRWLLSSQSQANPLGRVANSTQQARHNSARLPRLRPALPPTQSGSLARRHSVQAPFAAAVATGVCPPGPLLFGAPIATQFPSPPPPSSSVASSSAGTSGTASLSAPAFVSAGNGRTTNVPWRPSFETRTPNGGSLHSIHEAAMEEQQVLSSGVIQQNQSNNVPTFSQRRPSLYMTAQRPPIGASLRSVSVDPASPSGVSSPVRVAPSPPSPVPPKEMVVHVLASANHIGPPTSRSFNGGAASEKSADLTTDQVDDPGTHSPWYPLFVRRLVRAIYSSIWVPASERLAPSVRQAFSNPNSRLWLALDILVSLADLFYMIVIPVALAFVCDTPKGFTNVQCGVDIVMMFALVLDYHRPRRDKYGQLITDSVQRKRYFWQSGSNRRKVVSCIPFDWMMHGLLSVYIPGGMRLCFNPTSVYEFSDGSVALLNTAASGARLVKVHERYSYLPRDIDRYAVAFTAVRLIRLLHISDTVVWFRNMRVSGLSRAISRLAKNLLAAAYISLWNAVLFWFLSSHLDSPKRYIVNYMFDPDTHIPTSFTERIIWAYVDGQKALFFILREVKLVQESAYQAVEMMLGAIVYGSIFGNLVSIVKSLDDQAEFEKTIKQRNFKKAYLRQYLIENQFPQSLQQRILDQEELDFALKKGMDMDAIFNTFPRTMKQEILIHLYWGLISKVPLFSKTSDMFKLALLERISTVSVQSGFYIFKAGDAGTDLFFIKRGSVQILTGDESKVIVTLQAGAFFGEIALIDDCQRTATAKTAAETQLCALSKPDFLEIMRTYPAMAELVHQHVREKHEADARRKAEEERVKLEAAAKAALENQHHRSHHSGLLSGMLNRGRNGTLSRHATLLRGGSGSKGPSLAGTLRFGTFKRSLMSRKDAVVGSIRSLASGAGGSRAGDDLKNLEASRHGLVSGGDLQQMFTANRPMSEDEIVKEEEEGELTNGGEPGPGGLHS